VRSRQYTVYSEKKWNFVYMAITHIKTKRFRRKRSIRENLSLILELLENSGPRPCLLLNRRGHAELFIYVCNRNSAT
jgi:hypothetical protein